MGLDLKLLVGKALFGYIYIYIYSVKFIWIHAFNSLFMWSIYENKRAIWEGKYLSAWILLSSMVITTILLSIIVFWIFYRFVLVVALHSTFYRKNWKNGKWNLDKYNDGERSKEFGKLRGTVEGVRREPGAGAVMETA